MFCPNCGTNIPDGTKFCPKCGGRIDEETSGRQEHGSQAKENETPDSGNAGQQGTQSTLNDTVSKYRKKLTPRIIGIIIAAVVVIAIIVVLIVVLSNNGGGGGSTAVDLNNYVDITAEGYDGYGTVSYVFDTSTFVSDYAEKVAYRTENGSAQPSVSAARSLAERVADAGTFTKSEDLSNDEEITFSWDFNPEEIEDLYDVNLKYEDISYEVEGLEELKEVDVLNGGELDGNKFDGITVEFSGTSPQGTASVDTANSIDGVTPSMFTLSKSSWLANGDTVTVSITDEGKEQIAEKCGIVPTETEKEFTVEGLAFYPSDISEIPEDSFKTAWTRIEDDYSEKLDNQWSSSSDTLTYGEHIRKLVSFSYDGCYYFVNEETGKNTLIFIYEVNALENTIEDGTNQMTTPINYYWFGYYEDIIVSEDGTWLVPSEYYTMNDLLGDGKTSFESEFLYLSWAFTQTETTTYTGFQYLDEMTQEIKSALPNYTLANDTVTKEEENEAGEGEGEGEPAPEENNEGEGEAPEENNEGEQQEGD